MGICKKKIFYFLTSIFFLISNIKAENNLNNINLTITATNGVMPLPKFSIPMTFASATGLRGNVAGTNPARPASTAISIADILSGNVILKDPDGGPTDTTNNGTFSFSLPNAADIYDILEVGQSISCLFSVTSFNDDAQLIHIPYYHTVDSFSGPPPNNPTTDERANGRMNFFGWDSTDPAGIARSYLEPGTDGLNAKRARITLKYKRTQRLYFTNMG